MLFVNLRPEVVFKVVVALTIPGLHTRRLAPARKLARMGVFAFSLQQAVRVNV